MPACGNSDISGQTTTTSVVKKRQLGEEVGTVRKLVWVGESYRDLAHTL
jgi:hypothetical protein